jgi:hypothetical protein
LWACFRIFVAGMRDLHFARWRQKNACQQTIALQLQAALRDLLAISGAEPQKNGA